MKKNLITVIILFALLFTACDSLWQINNGASVSFNINLEEILKDSTNSFEIGVDASQPSVAQNLSVFPGSQPGDDFTGDDLMVTVTLHNTQNDAIIANQTLTAAQARNTNVVFDQLTAGQTVYAKIEVLFSDEYTEQRGGRDPLYFGARSENAVLKIAENVLAARTNAVFVTPGGMDSTGFTPFNTVSTIEKAVEVLGGVGNFLPGATVYVDGTFNISKDTTWNYPGLTILNNSSKSIVRAGVGADVSAKIEFNGITFRGNPNIAATESMFWVDNAQATFKDVTITDFNGAEEGLAAVRISTSGSTGFEGLVNISENNTTSNNKTVSSNVVFEAGSSAYQTPLGVAGPLDPASKIYLNPIIVAMDTFTLVVSEIPGNFIKENFVFPAIEGYQLEIEESTGSLIAVAENVPSEEGTIEFMFKETESATAVPAPELYLDDLKPNLGLPSVGVMWGVANTDYAHIALVTKEALLEDFNTIEEYLVYLGSTLEKTIESFGYFTVDTSTNGSYLTVTLTPVPPPETGTIEFYTMNFNGDKKALSADDEGYLMDAQMIVSNNATWETAQGQEHIATISAGFSTYAETIVEKALEKGYVVTATLDSNRENTLIVDFIYEGSVIFLAADGSPLDTPEFESIKPTLAGTDGQPIPGTWGATHILTITGSNVKAYVDYYNANYDPNTAPAGQKEAIDSILDMSLQTYLMSFVVPMINNSLGSAGAANVTQTGNSVTVQTPPIIPTNAIADSDIAPQGFISTTGTWEIVNGELPQSALATVTVQSGTTYEQIKNAIQAEISIPNVTIRNVRFPYPRQTGAAISERVELYIDIEASGSYVFEETSSNMETVYLNFEIIVEAPETGTIVFVQPDPTGAAAGTPITEPALSVAKEIVIDDGFAFTWGTSPSMDEHIVTVTEDAYAGGSFASMNAFLNSYKDTIVSTASTAGYLAVPTLVENTLTVAFSQIVNISASNFAPNIVGATVTGSWEIVDGALSSSFNGSINLYEPSQTFEQIESEIQTSLSFEGATVNSVSFTDSSATGAVTTSGDKDLQIILSANPGYVFTGGVSTYSFTISIPINLVGRIVFTDSADKSLSSDSDSLAEIKLTFRSSFIEPNYVWGTGSEAHILTVFEEAMADSVQSTMFAFLQDDIDPNVLGDTYNLYFENDAPVGNTLTAKLIETYVTILFFNEDGSAYSLTQADVDKITNLLSQGQSLGDVVGAKYINYYTEEQPGFADEADFINSLESIFSGVEFYWATEKAGTLLVVTIP